MAENNGSHTLENEHDEPTIAPGLNTHDPLEENASRKEIEHGNSTTVTRLYLDRTPEE